MTLMDEEQEVDPYQQSAVDLFVVSRNTLSIFSCWVGILQSKAIPNIC